MDEFHKALKEYVEGRPACLCGPCRGHLIAFLEEQGEFGALLAEMAAEKEDERKFLWTDSDILAFANLTGVERPLVNPDDNRPILAYASDKQPIYAGDLVTVWETHRSGELKGIAHAKTKADMARASEGIHFVLSGYATGAGHVVDGKQTWIVWKNCVHTITKIECGAK